jgi:hypothetical protein
MRVTLRELIEKKGWNEFRLNTRLRTSDSYILCEKIAFEDWTIQLLLDNIVYNYSISNGMVTFYIQD